MMPGNLDPFPLKIDPAKLKEKIVGKIQELANECSDPMVPIEELVPEKTDPEMLKQMKEKAPTFKGILGSKGTAWKSKSALDFIIAGVAHRVVEAIVEETRAWIPHLRLLITDQAEARKDEPAHRGQFVFDASRYLNRSIFLRGIIWVQGETDPLGARLSLYNVTDGETVIGSAVQTSSTVPVCMVSKPLKIGEAAGNLRPSERIYEAHLELLFGGGPLDCALAGHVELVIE